MDPLLLARIKCTNSIQFYFDVFYTSKNNWEKSVSWKVVCADFAERKIRMQRPTSYRWWPILAMMIPFPSDACAGIRSVSLAAEYSTCDNLALKQFSFSRIRTVRWCFSNSRLNEQIWFQDCRSHYVQRESIFSVYLIDIEDVIMGDDSKFIYKIPVPIRQRYHFI